jgi:hypothetical protein
MTESSVLLNYSGQLDYKTVDLLLNDLKESGGFTDIDRETGRRVYAIVVECLENIIKYSTKRYGDKPGSGSQISVEKQDGKILIKACNLIDADKAAGLVLNLEKINAMDDTSLIARLKEKINKEHEKDEMGAGLGLMLIKLKSGNDIEFNVTVLDERTSYFELKISVNEYLS